MPALVPVRRSGSLSLVAPDLDGGCDKRSQATASTAALSGSDTFSSKGLTTLAMAMPEESTNTMTTATTAETTSLVETPAIVSFDRVLQQAREERHEFSKDEFAEILTTHQHSLLKQLNTVQHSSLLGFGGTPLDGHGSECAGHTAPRKRVSGGRTIEMRWSCIHLPRP